MLYRVQETIYENANGEITTWLMHMPITPDVVLQEAVLIHDKMLEIHFIPVHLAPGPGPSETTMCPEVAHGADAAGPQPEPDISLPESIEGRSPPDLHGKPSDDSTL